MIEIQVHPSDIRRRTRYFFFDRRRVVVGIVVLSFVLAGLIGSMAAPPVTGRTLDPRPVTPDVAGSSPVGAT